MPITFRTAASKVLLLLTSLLLSTEAENAGCPCLTTDGGALDSYKFGGQLYYDTYAYPNDYGMRSSLLILLFLCGVRFSVIFYLLID
jgi:hypothetical protein